MPAVSVEAPSRLHFGLLSVAAADPLGALLGRRFGSVGLMVERPGLLLRATPAPGWSAGGPLAERALAYAHQFAASLGRQELPPQRLVVEQAPPEHAGLGTGTQLGMAVARALHSAWQLPEVGNAELARRVGRGLRSGVGVHGFAEGGFLVDAGKRDADRLAPLVARVEFPPAWRVVVALPTWFTGVHGERERRAFADLQSQAGRVESADALCRLVLFGLVPALAEADLAVFGEALFEFNSRAGEWFAPAQGGRYAHPRIAEVVGFVRAQGVRGVGQSSWGPTVFAVAGDEEQARHLARQLRQRFGLEECQTVVTAARNRGATLLASSAVGGLTG
jgi:beta-RFAP synthase